MRRLLLALAVPAAALVGCNAGFDPQYRVTDLRVLAVRTQAEGTLFADVAQGDLLRLEALVANPLGPPDPVVSWYACAPEEADPTRVPPCVDPEFQRDPAGLASDPRFSGRVSLVAEGAVPLPIPIPWSAAVQVALQTAYVCRPYVEIPLVVVAERNGVRQVATKSVRVVSPDAMADASSRNANPDVGDVRRAPADEDACTGGSTVGGTAPFPAGETVVCGTAATLPEEFPRCDASGVYRAAESLEWQWYVTAGTFPEFGGQGNAVGGAVEFERPPDAFTLWGILRDGRGGVSWTARDVPAPP